MELIRNIWTNSDIKEFASYLNSLRETGEKKLNWTKRIYNTNLPVLGIKVPVIKKIAKEIVKGNFISFLKLNPYTTFEDCLINGCLISKLKDFDTMKLYLDTYSTIIDNWALCDCLDFEIKKDNENKFFNLSMDYVQSNQPFKKRIGILLWFKFINNEQFIKSILNTIPNLKNENHYYVNMALAWFVCECFIKNKALGYYIFKNHILNKFVTNKSIQKIKDSFRVDIKDKKILEKYKQK